MRLISFASVCCLFTVSISAFRLGILSDIHIGEGCPSPYNFEENCYSVQSARRTINLINSNLTDIDLIIITGDITGSGQRSQYEKAYEVLSNLQVPWVPLIGNHDTWPYASTYELPTPIGDAFFGDVFGPHIKNSKFVSHYPNITAFDPFHGFNQTPQNIEITFPLGEQADGVIFGGDFNTRMHALLGDKGNLGQADLNDFEDGAIDWFKKRLQVKRDRPVAQAFMAQHQPIKCPWYIPNAGFCFSGGDQDALRAAMKNSTIAESAFWGAFAGHIHEWGWYNTIFGKDGKGFETFHQLQVGACKGNQVSTDINGAIAIVPITENGVEINGIERRWHDSTKNEWFFATGPPSSSTEREVMLHQILQEREFAE